MNIFYGILIFVVAFNLGFFFHAWWANMGKYSGTMVVREDTLRDKLVYTLILDDYPEELKFKKTVVFKVDASEVSSDDRE